MQGKLRLQLLDNVQITQTIEVNPVYLVRLEVIAQFIDIQTIVFVVFLTVIGDEFQYYS